MRTRQRLLLALSLLLGACAPRLELPGPALGPPALTADTAVMADGVRLPLRVWLPREGPTPRRTLVAVHGFNDYGHFIERAAEYLAERGTAVYAYDQRGFGAAPGAGLWHGGEAMAEDLRAVVRLVRQRHPGVPLHLLGESMGGAVAMVALTSNRPPEADSSILVAPAVWGRSTMPWYQPPALWLAAHTVPWLKLTGRGIKRHPSDNLDMLRAQWLDPMVIKETRVDALWGLTNLMDQALEASARLRGPVLILQGEHDDIIPPEATQDMLRRLGATPAGVRIAFYPNGYHMLLRDLQAEIVWADIAAWMEAPDQPLPSTADRREKTARTALDVLE